MSVNMLDKIMEEEGLSNAALARLSGISDKTISKVRRAGVSVSPLTRHKIVKGLNSFPEKLREYNYTDLFGE